MTDVVEGAEARIGQMRAAMDKLKDRRSSPVCARRGSPTGEASSARVSEVCCLSLRQQRSQMGKHKSD
jgi:hypothetical protein